jgi:hypothetical protein
MLSDSTLEMAETPLAWSQQGRPKALPLDHCNGAVTQPETPGAECIAPLPSKKHWSWWKHSIDCTPPTSLACLLSFGSSSCPASAAANDAATHQGKVVYSDGQRPYVCEGR